MHGLSHSLKIPETIKHNCRAFSRLVVKRPEDTKLRKRSICALDPVTLQQYSLDSGICRSSNAVCLHTRWLQHSVRCLYLQLTHKERWVCKARVGIVLCIYSCNTDIPPELYWQRQQSCSGSTKDVSEPQGQIGETWFVRKLGGHMEP